MITSKKMQLTTDSMGRVTLSYDAEGERVTREFTCPVDGGYVREGGDLKQVCDGLDSRGSTLRSDSIYTLADVIRREYRSMRSSEKREASRYTVRY